MRLFELTGGRLCLDFANTVDDRPTDRPSDRLTGYAELIAFGRQAGICSEAEARDLRGAEKDNPRVTKRLFRSAVELRETIYRIGSAVASGSSPSAKDLEALGTTMHILDAHASVVSRNGRLEWTWAGPERSASRLLWRIAHSSVDLLTSDEAKRLRQCAADDCNWLFIDNSRGHNRRWCEMRTCGNRHKAKSYYQRKTRPLKVERDAVSRRHGNSR